MWRWWFWPAKNTASTWISRCSARARNQYVETNTQHDREPGGKGQAAKEIIASIRNFAWLWDSASGFPKPQR